MIESRLDPATDGAGGGYGKYPGLTVQEIAERFRFLVEEGQGRSARAILRIVTSRRRRAAPLGTQRLLAALSAAATVALFLLRLIVAPETRAALTAPLLAAAGVTALFAVGAATVHRATVRGQAQVREIRRLALVALDLLVAREGFAAKGLEREHVAALSTLKRIDREMWEKVSRSLGR